MASPETLPTPDLLTSSLLAGTEANLWCSPDHYLTLLPCHLERVMSPSRCSSPCSRGPQATLQWTQMPGVRLVLHPISSGDIWQLGQAGPGYLLQAGILPGYSPDLSSCGRNLRPVEHDPLLEPSWLGSSHPPNCYYDVITNVLCCIVTSNGLFVKICICYLTNDRPSESICFILILVSLEFIISYWYTHIFIPYVVGPL